MTLTRNWKTTNRPNGPSGYKREGTFRDVTMVGTPPKYIDKVDAICIDRGINRSQLISEITGYEDAERQNELGYGWYHYDTTEDAWKKFPPVHRTQPWETGVPSTKVFPEIVGKRRKSILLTDEQSASGTMFVIHVPFDPD